MGSARRDRHSQTPKSVASLPRVAPYPRRPRASYGVRVSNGQDESDTEWARYLKEVTTRPDWSVARLAREAGLDRGTIFRWIKGGGDRVTVDSVRRISEATGDNLDTALRAAGGLPIDDDTDDDTDELEFEISMILRSDLPEAQKQAMVDYARDLQRRQRDERRALVDRQRSERRSAIQRVMDIARGGPQAAH